MLRAGIVLAASVCRSVCASVCPQTSRKLLIRNWCNLVGMSTMMNARSDWKLVTFDLDLWPWELFSYFFNLGYTPSEWLYLAISFLVRRYVFRISMSRYSFKVIRPRSRSRQQKNGHSLIILLYVWFLIKTPSTEVLLLLMNTLKIAINGWTDVPRLQRVTVLAVPSR